MAELQDFSIGDKIACKEEELWTLIFKENKSDRHEKPESEQQEIRGIIAQTGIA